MSAKKILSFPNIIAAAYIILTAIGLYHHAMWSDEMQHWLLARDSKSLPDLVYNMRYEGHPILWESLLFIIARFSNDPMSMQVLNLIISSATAILILNYAPFPMLMRTLIVFSYFLFYEYADISRNYSLGCLLIVYCCILYRNRYLYYILLSVVMGLLANTHLLCLFISFAIFAALLFDGIFYATLSPHQKKMALVGVLIYVVFVALSIWQIIPPSNSLFKVINNNMTSFHRICGAVSIITKGFLPFPDIRTLNWWNTNWFTTISTALNALLTLFILAGSLLVLIKKPLTLLIFFISFSGVASFIFFFQIGEVRYYGLIFISFIAALWIGEYYPAPVNFNKVLNRLHRIIVKPFIYTVLVIQVISAGVAYGLDIKRPFSQAKNTANYLHLKALDKHTIIVNIYSAGPPIAGYLGKQVFYPRVNQWGSYCKWSLYYKASHYTTLASLKELYTNNDSTLVLVLDRPITDNTGYIDPAIRIQHVKDFTGSTVFDENYYIYLMTPKNK